MRKKRLFTLFVMAALPMALRAELRELSFMTAMPAKSPLVIDGALSEDAWRSGVANKNYYKYIDPKGTRHTDFDTRCTILFDEKGLYTGVVNYQSDTAALRRQSVRNNDTDMWLDDCAELYYDPVANGVSYYKFVVNANGKNDSSWRMDAANYHKDWRAKGVVSAAKVFDDRWELEIFIPWEAFGVKSTPDAGSFWLFNHSRSRGGRGAVSALRRRAPAAVLRTALAFFTFPTVRRLLLKRLSLFLRSVFRAIGASA